MIELKIVHLVFKNNHSLVYIDVHV